VAKETQELWLLALFRASDNGIKDPTGFFIRLISPKLGYKVDRDDRVVKNGLQWLWAIMHPWANKFPQ